MSNLQANREAYLNEKRIRSKGKKRASNEEFARLQRVYEESGGEKKLGFMNSANYRQGIRALHNSPLNLNEPRAPGFYRQNAVKFPQHNKPSYGGRSRKSRKNRRTKKNKSRSS